MLMDYHSIIIINPSDEKPHCISGSKVHIKYQHGNVTIKCKFKMSFVLVFRVVQRYELYNVMNNMSITNTEKFMDINFGSFDINRGFIKGVPAHWKQNLFFYRHKHHKDLL